MMQPRKIFWSGLAADARWLGFAVTAAVLAASPAVAESGKAGSPQRSTLAGLPLYFEANGDPAGSARSFIARGRGCNFMVAPTEAALTLVKYDAPPASSRAEGGSRGRGRTMQTRTLHFDFPGANPLARVAGNGELPGKVNYLIGNDPAQWRTARSLFARVRVENIYPGVDLVYYGNGQQLEYDFIVAPKVDPRAISIHITGADKIHVDAQGDLVFTLGRDEIRQPKPLIYQTVGGKQKAVSGGYKLTAGQTVAFQIGEYDRALPLVIDPVLSYATFLGGAGEDTAWDIAADAAGNAYIAGETLSTPLPTTPGAYQTNYAGGTTVAGDAFVAKISRTGSNLLYLTYLGGRMDDGALALAIDSEGCAYVTGFTDSTNFPVRFPIPGQSAIHGTNEPYLGRYPLEAFVAKLNTNGSALVYSTFLGGTNTDEGVSIAVDGQGSAYVAGFTDSRDFPTINAFQPVLNLNGTTNVDTSYDAFVAKLSPGGSNLLYSTFLGGTNADRATGIAVDKLGTAYVTGLTDSTNFPTFNANQPRLAGGLDAFIAAIDASGNLVKSTYFGGRGDDVGFQVAVDLAGNVFVTGSKTSDDFPTSPGALNPGGVFRSDDAAANWNAAYSGLPHPVVYSLAIDPVTPAKLYAGTGRGVARSSDGGITWDAAISVAATSTNNLAPTIAVDSVFALAIDPNAPATVYAGTVSSVFKSVNGGVNWTLYNTGLVTVAVNALVFHPTVSSTLYAGTEAGVFMSTNSAATWTNASVGLGNSQVKALAVDPLASGTLYAATAGGVFRSTNGGANWSAYSAGLTNLSVSALVADPTAILYAGTAAGIFRRVNAGTNWVAINTGLTNAHVKALAVDPATPATVYAGTTNGLFKSLNGGNSWSAATNGLAVPGVTALAIHPAAPATLYSGALGIASFGGTDAFLAKFGTDGFCIVFGGSGKDEGWDVAVDKASGNPYVVGATTSTNFQTTQPAGLLRATNSGASDAFLAIFDSAGTGLNFAGYLGGRTNDFGYGLDVDLAGNAYVVGETVSTNFPAAGGFQPAYAGGAGDAFVARICFAPAQPVLNVAPSGADVLLSWYGLVMDFELESTESLSAPAVWTPVSSPAVNSNGLNLVTVPGTNAAAFFRLRGN